MSTETQQVTNHECGCVTGPSDWGVTRSYHKCEVHAPHQVPTGLDYYARMGCVTKEGFPLKCNHQSELLEPLTAMGVPLEPLFPSVQSGKVLEVGCGTGSYITMFLRLGFDYQALEPCLVAADWCRNLYGVEVYQCLFEDMEETLFDIVFSAHTAEHFVDSPAMLTKMYRMLYRGGRLILLVPDDTDLLNPDHLWFYTEASLKGVLEHIGFEDVRTTVRSIAKHENYIFCHAVKP